MLLTDAGILIALIASELICISVLVFIKYKIEKGYLKSAFILLVSSVLISCTGAILQDVLAKPLNINPIYFEYFSYVGNVFMPIGLLATGIVYGNKEAKFRRWHLLFLIVPIVSLVLLWTNEIFGLFFKTYSLNTFEIEYGPYYFISEIYSIILMVVGIISLIIYFAQKFGFVSRQVVLVMIAVIMPFMANITYNIGLFNFPVYIKPIIYSVSLFVLTYTIFRLNISHASPIAIQKIIDKISDSYVLLDDLNRITDYNHTFITTFKLKDTRNIRGTTFEKFFNKLEFKINFDKINRSVQLAKEENKTSTFELYIEELNKYFRVEVSSLLASDQSFGVALLFKDITQHKKDIEEIKNNQANLMERERLATLGQMIGGVAHNLKTPIMSISGATEGLEDLITEYKESVGDKDVTIEDHQEIADEMMNWVIKIRTYDNYMSDIITAVKGQAVNMNEDQNNQFTVEELLSRVNLLMKHELKSALVTLNEDIKISKYTTLHGNINSMVQVVNNLISNAIQAYGPADSIQEITANGSSFIKGNGSKLGSGEKIGQKIDSVSTKERVIDLIIYEKNDSIVISVSDNGCGIPEDVQKKLFKQMVTTKGHNGSGLGLFMSYSTIKGNFGGKIDFSSKVGKGTKFNVTIPRK